MLRMRPTVVRLCGLSPIFLFIGLSAFGAAPPTTSTKAVLVHTQGLGTILTSARGTDAATSTALRQKLAALRAKYANAVFVDGGDTIGPIVFRETQFGFYGLSTYRVFDQNRYAAAALSARDGLHAFSFYALLPPKSGIQTPLVGTFETVLKPEPGKNFLEIKPRSATAQCGGAKLQIFGVATSMSLTGIVDPLANLKSAGAVEGQARYILANLEAGRVPVVLSDLSPKENDTLAGLLKRNALIFEGGYPWRLANKPPRSPRSRTIGPVRIISHFSPGQADVVELPRDLRCARAAIRTETIWTPKPPAWASQRRGLFSRKPLEARLVQSAFTETLLLPAIGTKLGSVRVGPTERLKDMLIAFDNEKNCRVPPYGARDWVPPRWMQQSRHLRDNEIIYRYDLRFRDKPMARVYHMAHAFVPGITVGDFLVAVDDDHRIMRWHVYYPPSIAHRLVRVAPVLERLKEKSFSEIRLEDWPERAGAEFVVDNIVRDAQLLLAWDEMAD